MSVKIYGIRDVITKAFHEFNNKTCWKSQGAAKLSFNAHRREWNHKIHGWDEPKFDDQKQFEIIELTEIVWMYEDLQS